MAEVGEGTYAFGSQRLTGRDMGAEFALIDGGVGVGTHGGWIDVL